MTTNDEPLPPDDPCAAGGAAPHAAEETPAAAAAGADITGAGVVAVEAADMTAEQLAEARQYGRRSLVCDLADKALDVGFLAAVVAWGAVPLDAWIARRVPAATPRLLLLFLAITLAHVLVSFPLSLYAGHALEVRYGLSRQSLAGWFKRYLTRNAIALVFGLLMVPALYWLIWLVGAWWWLAAALGFFLVTVVLGQLFPVLVLPLLYKVERLDDPQLAERMARLAAGTGLSIEGVYRLGLSDETAKANAMLTGLGATRRVVMGDTLLDQFTPDEIEVIFAHEIGHHVFRHIRKLILAGVLFSLAGFWLCDRVVLAWTAAQTGAAVDPRQLPTNTLPLVMLVLTLFGLLLEPLQNVISRRYERQCDRYALERTGLRTAYSSAFRKLARINKDDPAPHPLEVFLFHSHPPIGERLRLADDA